MVFVAAFALALGADALLDAVDSEAFLVPNALDQLAEYFAEEPVRSNDM